MILFLPFAVWKNRRGFPFGKKADYLRVGWHTGQDFFTNPVGTTPVIAPSDGVLVTFPFSKSAGWWGYFLFEFDKEKFSLKILHMYKKMKAGKYKEGEVLGYCGATGQSITAKYGTSYIGQKHEEQISDKAIGHLHAELHRGEYQHDTNLVKALAKDRIMDPVVMFEKWTDSIKN